MPAEPGPRHAAPNWPTRRRRKARSGERRKARRGPRQRRSRSEKRAVSAARHDARMDDVHAGRALRRLRTRRGLTQSELAALAGVSQSSVSLVERGHLDRLSLRTVRRLFAGVEATYDSVVRWRGGALDRLLDERHSALVETIVRQLEAARWDVAVEVSFNHFGDRGSIDVLGLHRRSRIAVVIEVKSELTDAEGHAPTTRRQGAACRSHRCRALRCAPDGDRAAACVAEIHHRLAACPTAGGDLRSRPAGRIGGVPAMAQQSNRSLRRPDVCFSQQRPW